jgi:hypothetical protein
LAKLTVDPRTLSRFSPATRTQLDLSREVAASVDNQPLSKIVGAAKQALERDSDWVEFAKARLGEVEKHDALFSESAVAERQAFETALRGDSPAAAVIISAAADLETSPRREGILLEAQAVYTDAYDPAAAQQILAVARAKNPYVVRPLSGVTYQQLLLAASQAETATKRLLSEFTSAASIRLHVEAIIDDLTFVPDRAEEFEEALYDAGRLIGLGSQRPERETNKGPDNLWALGDNVYWVIEAKNGVTNSKGIGKRDMGQLTQSMQWFGNRYDSQAVGVPIMAHRATAVYSDVSPQAGTRIITPRLLGEFSAALRGFAEGLASVGWSSAEEVGRLLEGHKLTAGTLQDAYTEVQRGEV